MDHDFASKNVPHSKNWLVVGALLAAVAIATGAIGAHLIKDWVMERYGEEASRRQELWETAARYQMYQAVGLMLLAMVSTLANRQRNIVGTAMLAGALIFCGCLYGYVMLDVKMLVHIVPIGGFSMIIGWALLAWFVFSRGNISTNEKV